MLEHGDAAENYSWYGYADEDKASIIDSLNDPIRDEIDPECNEGKEDFVDGLAQSIAERAEVVNDDLLDAEEVCAEALRLINDCNDRSNKKQKRIIQRRLQLARVIGLIKAHSEGKA